MSVRKVTLSDRNLSKEQREQRSNNEEEEGDRESQGEGRRIGDD